MIVRRAVVVAALTLAAGTLPAVSWAGTSATAADPIFRPGARFDASAAKVSVHPDRYSAVTVDVDAARAALAGAPAVGRSGEGVTFKVPTPSGGEEAFDVQRTEVMQPQLAAAHPEIETFAGLSLDHPGTTIAMDITPMGFHASVRGPSGQDSWYVDPAYDLRGTTTDLSYYGASVGPSDQQQFVERETPELAKAPSHAPKQQAAGGLVTQRVYRLALTSDPSYATYFGSANVLAAKVTLINRVDQIYNDDLAIWMKLVNAEDSLNLDTDAKATGPNGPCGAHACFDLADPSVPSSAGQLDFCDVPTLGRNRTVLGQLVGASNYDIGHIALGVNGGGIAYLGVVGSDYKGGGCTGLPTPRGDFYAVDYVAHEMGHEFGGNHPFNGTQYNCSGANRVRRASVEPGSGSSVMAYAGICQQDNLQPHSDPYFSERSQTEIGGYTSNQDKDVNEVQTVSLTGFTTPGDQITLSFPGTAATQTLTLGSTYSAAGIAAAVQALTGKQVTVAQWGYDPFDTTTRKLAPPKAPDATGFQVIFAPSYSPFQYGGDGDVASLGVTSASAGVSGFVGETAKGGAADNLGTDTVTSNHAPTVTAPRSRTIPILTPFRLTGHGKDKDGDALTYLWEQNDRGGKHGTALVDNHKVFGPLFRMFGIRAHVTSKGTLQTPSPHENLATRSATRYFPDLQQVLDGNTNIRTGRCPAVAPPPKNPRKFKPVPGAIVDCYSEFLPTRIYRGDSKAKQPSMHFRLTARDDNPNGGGDSHADVILDVDHSAGPFLVTSQAGAAAHYAAGGHARISWKVNNTQRLARNVRILVSADGGATWKVVDRRTANDGSAMVKLPGVHTSKARVMVAALGNYFYAVNAKGFAIG